MATDYETIKSLMRNIASNPRDADAYFKLAILYQYNDITEKAIKCYLKAIEIGPENPFYYFYLGKLYREAGRYAEAVELYKKTIVDVSADLSMGWVRDNISNDYLTLEKRFDQVEGYLFGPEGHTLMMLAEEASDLGPIVEIGSFMGRSTCWLATGVQKKGKRKVTAVDHFRGSDEHQKGEPGESSAIVLHGSTFNGFVENLQAMGLYDHVHPVVAASDTAVKDWTGGIGLLFIDGDHSYEASKNDFQLWSPFVVSGGYVAFHDIGAWQGVSSFYKELTQATTCYKEVVSVLSLRVLQKG